MFGKEAEKARASMERTYLSGYVGKMYISREVAEKRYCKVRHRLLYSCYVTRNYMPFKVLNVIASNSDFYIIESLHETIIPGRMQLIVEDSNVTEQINSKGNHSSTSTSPSSTPESVTWNMGVFGMAVVVGVVVVFLFTLGCLIRIQHKNTHRLESVQRFVVEKLNAVSFATPSTIQRNLPKPPTPVVNWFHDPNSDQTEMIGLHYTEIPMNEHREETSNHIEKEPNSRVQEIQSEVKKRSCASETKRTWNPPENLMSGTSRESGYDVVAGVINMTSEAVSKIYDGRDASMLNTKEQKVNITTSNAEYNEYDHITLK
ncbi:hypothetical protein ACJMK2_031715 [Sinanodonta woodiana]|uniref:Uncharacterized protein n=1 Tax=Sinanodonta woodiana TaxID=1069815 RepID=A0ABD3X058_SINWO